jgi:hypothetical protein
VHAAPLPDRATQLPVRQKNAAAHSPSPVHEVGQAELEPPHTNGEHDGLPAEPIATSVHVPAEPATLHALQEPAHAPLQHTPSTQKPLVQAFAPPQATPLPSFGTHAPAWQKRPAAQSASPPQLVGQDALEPLQTYAPHVDGVPCATGLHVPALPVRSQRSHAPPHAVSQHTESAQLPEVHSVPSVHAPPSPFRPIQTFVVQVAPGAQLPGPAHVVPHAALVPLQRNGAHDGEPGAVAGCTAQCPAALQVSHAPPHAASQHTESAQKPDWQALPAAQALPSVRFGTHAPIEQKLPAAQSASPAQPVGHELSAPLQT